MLKPLVDRFRSKPPEPTVFHGRHSDIWGDPNARDYGWYCGWCGHNQSGATNDRDARFSATAHAHTHNEAIDVAVWK